jgi:hypothetical protein
METKKENDPTKDSTDLSTNEDIKFDKIGEKIEKLTNLKLASNEEKKKQPKKESIEKAEKIREIISNIFEIFKINSETATAIKNRINGKENLYSIGCIFIEHGINVKLTVSHLKYIQEKLPETFGKETLPNSSTISEEELKQMISETPNDPKGATLKYFTIKYLMAT